MTTHIRCSSELRDKMYVQCHQQNCTIAELLEIMFDAWERGGAIEMYRQLGPPAKNAKALSGKRVKRKC